MESLDTRRAILDLFGVLIHFIRKMVGRLWSAASAAGSTRNAFFSTVEGILVPMLWLLTAPLFLAHLGDEKFGLWMLVNGLIGMGGVLSFGLADATVRYLSEFSAKEDFLGAERVIRNSIGLYATLGMIVVMGNYSAAPRLVAWMGMEALGIDLATTCFRIAGFGVAARFLDAALVAVFQGAHRFDLNSKITMVTSVATTLMCVGLVLTGSGLTVLLIATVASVALGALLKTWVIRRSVFVGMRLAPQFDRSTIVRLGHYGFYSWWSNVFSLASQYLDRVLIAAHLGTAAVGYYAICVQLVGQIHLLLSRGASFLFPLASAIHACGDRERSRRVYYKASLMIVILAPMLVVPVYLLSDSLLQLWMGAEVARQAAMVLPVLILRVAVSPLGIVNFNYLMGLGMARLQAIISTMVCSAVLISMLILIPRLGTLGAAVSQLASIPFMFFTRSVIQKQLFGKVDLVVTLAYFFPVLVPLSAATWISMTVNISVGSPTELAMVGFLIAAAAGALALVTCLVCQRIGWMPRWGVAAVPRTDASFEAAHAE